MQKWEYLFVSWDRSQGTWTVNEKDLKDWKKTSIYDYVNSLGMQGWEMVNIDAIQASMMGGSVNKLWIVFKRPKP